MVINVEYGVHRIYRTFTGKHKRISLEKKGIIEAYKQ